MKSRKENVWTQKPHFEWEKKIGLNPHNKEYIFISISNSYIPEYLVVCECTDLEDGSAVAWKDCDNCLGFGMMPIDWNELS